MSSSNQQNTGFNDVAFNLRQISLNQKDFLLLSETQLYGTSVVNCRLKNINRLNEQNKKQKNLDEVFFIKEEITKTQKL